MPVLLEARGVRRSFDGEEVLAGVDLDIREGEFLVILGPSGCGKTTLLNILAGFDTRADVDRLELRGRRIDGGSEEIGVVFQEGSLFPWLTLRQNILFGSRMRAMLRTGREEKLRRYLKEFGLIGLEHKYPDQLSGGQQQRAAVARALVNRPALLLADEPFRALDSRTRLSSQIFLRHEIASRRETFCLITHDIDEALLLGDRLLILGHRPTQVEGEFRVELGAERRPATVLTEEFQEAKREFVEYCSAAGLPLFPDIESVGPPKD